MSMGGLEVCPYMCILNSMWIGTERGKGSGGVICHCGQDVEGQGELFLSTALEHGTLRILEFPNYNSAFYLVMKV